MQKTILVVEDDNAIRGDLETLLTLEGYQVLTAENGEAALKVLHDQSDKPSAVLLDIMMPIMDGWKFRDAQTQDPEISDIPVVVMTADGHAPQKATKMKAQGYVQKPIDLELLLEAIEKVVA